MAFVVGQFLDFVTGNERAKAVSDELPRRLWIPLALICSMGWLSASAGSALRTPFAVVAVVSLLYRAVDSLRRFNLAASLQMPKDGALETLEAFAILLPFCFACRWVVY